MIPFRLVFPNKTLYSFLFCIRYVLHDLPISSSFTRSYNYVVFSNPLLFNPPFCFKKQKRNGRLGEHSNSVIYDLHKILRLMGHKSSGDDVCMYVFTAFSISIYYITSKGRLISEWETRKHFEVHSRCPVETLSPCICWGLDKSTGNLSVWPVSVPTIEPTISRIGVQSLPLYHLPR